ncbi:low molecular weight protein-tyrosine-phosphatase [Aliivibrio kagoshimensis]|uniref:low molecular weight protein-tyrosine-phosphatase n=1 Tax=Aliivibrio kagoshimensis TaxID=2910230 RepID=UPI003D1243BE
MNKILVVCMANICRSPTGEAVLRAKAKENNVSVKVDSAGTVGHRLGHRPDPRSVAAGEKRGYSFKGIKSRKITQKDFHNYDLILASDKANLADLYDVCPLEHQHKLKLFLSFLDSDRQEIPDPYYGGPKGFELVIDLIEEGSQAVLKQFI